MFLRFKPHLNQVSVQATGIHTGGGGDSSGGGLPGSNQGKICSTDIDCVDKDWPGAIVSYIYFTDDAQPSQGVDENNPL